MGTIHKLRRRSPLEQPRLSSEQKALAKKRVNQLTQRGYFPGQEIVDNTRQHFEPDEVKRFFKALPTPFLDAKAIASAEKNESSKVGPYHVRAAFWYPYFFIQYFFGCRLSEPALILDEDVSFKKKLIVIRRLKKAREEQGFSEVVYAADERVLACVEAAKRYKRERGMGDNPFLFASNRRREETDVGAERLSQLRSLNGWQAVSRFTAHRKFQEIAKGVKVPVQLCHTHVLRHTRATLMLASGATIAQVQHLLGHSSSKMTQRYIGLAESVRHKLNSEILAMGLGL